MKNLFVFLLVLCAFCAKAQKITTIAGTVDMTNTGDGLLAINASIEMPYGVMLYNNDKRLLIVTQTRIREIDLVTGIISTFAGHGGFTSTGNGGPATDANLYCNKGNICMDGEGAFYEPEMFDYIVRKIDSATRIINGFAGTIGMYGNHGDTGHASVATLHFPQSLCINKMHKLLYVAEYDRQIRMIDLVTGIITSLLSKSVSAFTEDGHPASVTNLYMHDGIEVDSIGNLYIPECNTHTIRKIDYATKIVTTIAGNGTWGYLGDGGVATAASLGCPAYLCFDKKGNLYFTDSRFGIIRRIDAITNIITTVAGIDTMGFSGDNGPATNAALNEPLGICIDGSNNLYVSDSRNYRIRKIALDDTAYTIGIKTTTKPQPHIYPNPIRNTLHIDNITGNTQYQLYNMIGIISKQGILYAGNNSLSTEGLLPGIYTLVLKDEDGMKSEYRVLKE